MPSLRWESKDLWQLPRNPAARCDLTKSRKVGHGGAPFGLMFPTSERDTDISNSLAPGLIRTEMMCTRTPLLLRLSRSGRRCTRPLVPPARYAARKDSLKIG